MTYLLRHIINGIPLLMLLIGYPLSGQSLRWFYRHDGEGTPAYNSVIKQGMSNNLYASANVISGGIQRITVFNLSMDGESLWTYQYPTGGSVFSLDRDQRNFVYVAGDKSRNIFTVMCIDSCGSFEWEYNLGNAMAYEDNLVLCGQDGRIYAVGNRYATWTTHLIINVCFDTLGNVLWKDSLVHYTANCLIQGIGADNSIYVGGVSYILSYRTNGSLRWTYNEGTYNALTIGSDNIIYAAGYEWRAGYTYEDFYVIALDTAGNQLWDYQYSPAFDYPDRAEQIVQGTDKNIYVAGYCSFMGYNDDLIVISLDTLGNERWIYHIGEGAGTTKLVYGPDDNLYLIGTRHDNATYNDIFAMCIDTSGYEVWRYSFNDPGDEIAGSAIYGSDGDIYVSGYETGSGRPWDDFFVLSINTPTMIGEDHDFNSREKMDIFLTSIQRREISFAVRCDKPVRLLINIIDVLGRKIAEWQEDVPGRDHNYRKSVSGCSGGVYFLKVSDIDSKAGVCKKFILIN